MNSPYVPEGLLVAAPHCLGGSVTLPTCRFFLKVHEADQRARIIDSPKAVPHIGDHGNLDKDQPTVSIATLIEREYSAQVMFDQTDHCLARTRSRGIRTVVILFLCISVLMQMLGVPLTLLSPVLSLDTLGESVLEGFSIPPTVPLVTRNSKTGFVTDTQPSVHVPILASAVFHPPLL
jgi:hypothetical protein